MDSERAALIDDMRAAPSEAGTVRLIVRRPAVDAREVVDQATIELAAGLAGDSWRERGSRATPDGGPNPEAQLTVMNASVIARLAGTADRWPLAGDQLYVDLDLSESNLPAGARVRIGTAELEVSATPHTGCAKFAARFGATALAAVSSPEGRAARLRGVNCRVVAPGVVRTGDRVEVLARH